MNVHVTIFHKNFLEFACINLSMAGALRLPVNEITKRGPIPEHRNKVLPLVQ